VADIIRNEKAVKEKPQPEKIIVAVHGIGEQVRCETIQAVAYQFCKYYHTSAGFPLGRMSAELVPPKGTNGVRGAFMVKSPPDPTLPAGLGFAEIYWADVPRGPARDLYTLEAAQKWAKTVVARVRAADENNAKQRFSPSDYDLAAQVIGEMIQTNQVLGRLLFLSERAGLFKFDLDDVLVNYLGDVQVVAEFSNYRKQIGNLFHRVLEKVNDDHPEAEIYIVAHSEGTVIAFLGLLTALHQPDVTRPSWAKQVRGLMTIGSPINKHLLIWPELWDGLDMPKGSPPEPPIPWRNYYDYGDPVGFRLSATHNWLKNCGWARFFEFDADNPDHDVGFTRYYFAGRAHIDYWQDDGVFDHFISTVVKPPAQNGAHPAKKSSRPRTQFLPWVVSPTLPYVFVMALVFVAVYILYKAVGGFLEDSGDRNYVESLRNVAGISYILIAATAAVRIPRVTKHWGWRLIGVALLLAAVPIFPLLVTPDFLYRIGPPFATMEKLPGVTDTLNHAASLVADVPVLGNIPHAAVAILLVVGLAALVIWIIGVVRPSWGTKPLIGVGCAIVLAVVAFRVSEVDEVRSGIREALKNKYNLSGNELNLWTNALAADYANTGELSKLNLIPERKLQDVFGIEEFKSLAARQQRPVSEDMSKGKREGRSGDLKIEARKKAGADKPVWPVVLAAAAFIYLWWLAALLFDLVVAWHHYIRRSAILNRLNEISGGPKGARKPACAGQVLLAAPGGGNAPAR
jgi:hypothetical protein